MKKTIIAIITGLILVMAAFGQDDAQPSPAPSPDDVTNTGNQVEPKKEGTIRIGIVTIKAQLKQDGVEQDVSEIIRTRWYSFLNGPAVEVVPIESRVPAQVNIEAEQKQCDYVLYSAVSQKAKASLFGSLLGVAVPVLTSAIPAGGGGTAVSGATNSIKNTVQAGAKDAATKYGKSGSGDDSGQGPGDPRL